MGLDIRFPLGMIFLALGGILTVYGLFTRGNAMYAQALGINVNFIWGIVMLIFGAIMTIAAWRAKRLK